MDKPKSKKVSVKFLNPFDIGVSYTDFLKEVGAKTISEYCKGKLTNEQIKWLENDIKLIKK